MDQTAPDSRPVDVCALFTKEDFASVMGKPAGEPIAQAPDGTDLGSCTYSGADHKSMVKLSAYPSSDLNDMLFLYEETPVSGVGEKAYWIGNALLVQSAGKPYFLDVRVQPDMMMDLGFDQELSISVAQVAVGR